MTREDIAVRFRLLVVIATLAAGLATPLPAHHSLAEYDPSTLIRFSGTISEIKWVNPHSWITLMVRNPDGSTFTANIEVAGPAALLRKGFDRAFMNVGDSVVIETWKGKNPSITKSFSGRTLTLGDGRQFDVADNWMTQGLNGAPSPTR